MDFKDSKTYHNLMDAFKGEMTASTKYEIYGLKAKEDGYEQIGDIFLETSRNEREHGEIWMKLLHGGDVPPTLDNLKDAAAGENSEWRGMYPEYARMARQEGYSDIAILFEGVGNIENNHDKRFERLAMNIEQEEVFCRNQEFVWLCLNCGNLYWGQCAPEVCPVCGYPQGYYELYCENF